jgi:hypothetical protein
MPIPAFLQVGLGALQANDVVPYLGLRELLPIDELAARNEFQRLFSIYYGLRFLPAAARGTYFQLLFDFNHNAAQPVNDYAGPLQELFGITHRFEASFVSKLVSIHDETRPLYDRYVGGILGITHPRGNDFNLRIDGFFHNLNHIFDLYQDWSADPEGAHLVANFREHFEGFGLVHPHRILDFCVWSAGRVLNAEI